MIAFCAVLLIGRQQSYPYYEEYLSFFNPKYMMEEYGVLATVQRDLLGDNLLAEPTGQTVFSADVSSERVPEETVLAESVNEPEAEDVPVQQQGPVPHVLDLDFAKLNELTQNTEANHLVSYMAQRAPETTNAYTGMFEGYNLIYLTAEGFSPYCLSEELTPTLYRLANSGFVAENYYVPLWQTSTSDGEYVNLTGQIPYRQFSMKKSAQNEQPYSLPAYFMSEEARSFAYHNNSLSYYDRHLTHTNLGYDFKASKLGDLAEAEWGSQVFDMENADLWPASDLDMMKATIPEYIHEERFHVYYMTISGHMNYNFTGNRMASQNKDYVSGLSFSEEGRAYIACNIELDRALGYLIEELEKAGKLDNTVIALSADHYPYGMNLDNYEELAGTSLENSLELYKNTLILWNAQMTEPVIIEKVCGAMDLLPTLYNLFGFQYDSRLFAGTDMLSERGGTVIFADRSFITDEMIYNAATGETIGRSGTMADPEYAEIEKQRVRQIYDYSTGILRYNFFHYVELARK